mmetsp:Transcript_2594/g.9984  ORF Transcript_2594/g.9984 Transcript_2594/m.9984 type:complete len:236 (-) Transcript_2594:166-873(-)
MRGVCPSGSVVLLRSALAFNNAATTLGESLMHAQCSAAYPPASRSSPLLAAVPLWWLPFARFAAAVAAIMATATAGLFSEAAISSGVYPWRFVAASSAPCSRKIAAIGAASVCAAAKRGVSPYLFLWLTRAPASQYARAFKTHCSMRFCVVGPRAPDASAKYSYTHLCSTISPSWSGRLAARSSASERSQPRSRRRRWSASRYRCEASRYAAVPRWPWASSCRSRNPRALCSGTG